MRLTREDKLPNCTLVRLNAIAPETQEQEEVKDYDAIGLAPYGTDQVENGFLY